jgi:hypothetical protein
MTQLYYRDLTERVLELLRDNLSQAYGIKAYYDGDPVEFGMSSLPAICVIRPKASIDLGPTQNDRITSTTLIKLILDKRDDYGASQDTDLTDKRLRQMIEGRDTTTGQYKAETLVGVLRTFWSMNYFNSVNPILRSTAEVSYHLIDRRSPADQDLITMEGHVTLSVTEQVQVQNRS